MFTFKCVLVIVYFSAQWASFVYSKSLWFETCPSHGQNKKCEIYNLTMSPCDELHSDSKECSLTRGVTSIFRVEFVPFFSADKLYKHIYGITYDDNGNEIEADDTEHHNEDACNLTTCPVEAGKKYTLEYRHHLQQSYQPGHFLIKWRIGNKNDDCCVKIKVEIR